MRFVNPGETLTELDIDECEAELKIRFPASLRQSYLTANGGEPEPYMFLSNELETVVSSFLSLKPKDRNSAIKTYENLILEQKILPPTFFPFAVDGGGDYFFVNTKIQKWCCVFL